MGATPRSPREQLFELSRRLRPAVNRSLVLQELDRMFRAGAVPDPLPDGFLRGRVVATSIWGPADTFFRGLAELYMPWQGKTFDARTSTGMNRFSRSARVPLSLLWPAHAPLEDRPGFLQAFAFRNRVAPGAVDPGIDVYKIDYDFEDNPSFIIRRILDELVQVDDGVYLGKVLFRFGAALRPIGYFSLEAV